MQMPRNSLKSSAVSPLLKGLGARYRSLLPIFVLGVDVSRVLVAGPLFVTEKAGHLGDLQG
jgi:hypothetical protein